MVKIIVSNSCNLQKGVWEKRNIFHYSIIFLSAFEINYNADQNCITFIKHDNFPGLFGQIRYMRHYTNTHITGFQTLAHLHQTSGQCFPIRYIVIFLFLRVRPFLTI